MLKEMTTDLSKFLHHARGEGVQPGAAPDIDKVSSYKAVEKYVEELGQRSVGPSGIIGKLNVIVSAQSFRLHK